MPVIGFNMRFSLNIINYVFSNKITNNYSTAIFEIQSNKFLFE